MTKPCWFCGKKIKGRRVRFNYIEPLHSECKNLLIDRLEKAYSLQKLWKEALTDKQKRIMLALEKNGEMTIEEMSKHTEMPLHVINSVTKSLKDVVMKRHSFRQDGTMCFHFSLKDSGVMEKMKKYGEA